MVQLARMLSKPTTAQAAWKAPVIILHGFLAYSRSWTTMSKRIADATNREVHALDLRNHGNSPHTDRFCFDELVGDLRSYIETQIQASSCIVIGHSYGGMVLCKYMQMNAKRLTAGIVVDITPMKISEQTVQEFCSYIVAMQQAIKNEARTVQEVEKLLSVHIKEKALRAFLLTNLVRRNESFSWLPNLQVLHDGLKSGSALWSPLDSFSTKPALFVFGESSRYYKDQHREKNISQIFASSSRSNVEQAVIARSNHLPHAENPDHFLQVVTEYMSRFP